MRLGQGEEEAGQGSSDREHDQDRVANQVRDGEHIEPDGEHARGDDLPRALRRVLHQRRPPRRWIAHGAEALDRQTERVTDGDDYLEQRKGEIDEHHAHEQPGQQNASRVLAAQTVAPHDSIASPDDDHHEGCVRHELDLRLEPLNGHVIDEVAAGLEIGGGEDEAEPHLEQQSDAVVQQRANDLFRMRERPQQVDQLRDPDDEGLEVHAYPQWAAEVGTEFVRMLTSELATSTPIVPTTMRWIHCLAARADLDSTAVIFQMNAKMNARAPTDPQRAGPMWIQVVIRLVIGVMSGAVSRNSIRAS